MIELKRAFLELTKQLLKRCALKLFCTNELRSPCRCAQKQIRPISLSAKLSSSLILFTGLAAWMVGLSPSCIAAEATRLNIVVILADDMGYADVGFQGCTDIPTPQIDSLAKNGVRCTNGYVSGP